MEKGDEIEPSWILSRSEVPLTFPTKSEISDEYLASVKKLPTFSNRYKHGEDRAWKCMQARLQIIQSLEKKFEEETTVSNAELLEDFPDESWWQYTGTLIAFHVRRDGSNLVVDDVMIPKKMISEVPSELAVKIGAAKCLSNAASFTRYVLQGRLQQIPDQSEVSSKKESSASPGGPDNSKT